MLITFTCQLLSSSLFSPLLSFLSSDRDHRDLHPFPTRRSSDLIGTWAIDKLIRFCLVTRHSDPIVWDFRSAAKHHDLRSEEHTSELQSRGHLVCRLLLEKKKKIQATNTSHANHKRWQRNSRSTH